MNKIESYLKFCIESYWIVYRKSKVIENFLHKIGNRKLLKIQYIITEDFLKKIETYRKLCKENRKLLRNFYRIFKVIENSVKKIGSYWKLSMENKKLS